MAVAGATACPCWRCRWWAAWPMTPGARGGHHDSISPLRGWWCSPCRTGGNNGSVTSALRRAATTTCTNKLRRRRAKREEMQEEAELVVDLRGGRTGRTISSLCGRKKWSRKRGVGWGLIGWRLGRALRRGRQRLAPATWATMRLWCGARRGKEVDEWTHAATVPFCNLY
jgi:hypothetical protein